MTYYERLEVWIATIVFTFSMCINVNTSEKVLGDYTITLYAEDNEVEILNQREEGYTLRVIKYDDMMMVIDTTGAVNDTIYHLNSFDDKGHLEFRIILNERRASILDIKNGDYEDYIP